MRQFLLLGVALCVLPCFAGADTVRPAVGKPLQQAEALMQKHDYPAALLKVQEASKVSGLTSYENLVIAQVRGAAAAGAGDYVIAATAYQTILSSGMQSAPVRNQLIQSVAGFYYQAHDYPHAIIWVKYYIAAQGNDPRTIALLAQSYYQEGDYSSAEQSAWREQKAAQITGQALPEDALQLLACSAEKSGDQPGYQAALEILLKHYPNSQYWAEAINGLVASPNFPDTLMLDVYRLRNTTGTLTTPGDYEDYAERAILAGKPDEAKRVLDQGFTTGILTAGTDGGHAARLRALTFKDASPDAAQHADLAPDSSGKISADIGLDRGISYFDAGSYQASVGSFQTVPGYFDALANGPDVTLAHLWAIHVENISQGT